MIAFGDNYHKGSFEDDEYVKPFSDIDDVQLYREDCVIVREEELKRKKSLEEERKERLEDMITNMEYVPSYNLSYRIKDSFFNYYPYVFSAGLISPKLIESIGYFDSNSSFLGSNLVTSMFCGGVALLTVNLAFAFSGIFDKG